MAVLIPGRLLYLAHPRTASMATKAALLRLGGKDIRPHHAEFTRSAVRERYGGEPVVTVIRDPRDVLATWWLKAGRHEHSTPADFIAHYTNSSHFVRDGLLFYHVRHAHHVIRYEEGIAEGFAALGLSIDLEAANVTQGKLGWREYLDGAAIDAMRERFGAELETLGYRLRLDVPDGQPQGAA